MVQPIGEHCLLVHPQHSKIQSNTFEAGMRLIKEPVKPNGDFRAGPLFNGHSLKLATLPDIAYWHVEIGEDVRSASFRKAFA